MDIRISAQTTSESFSSADVNTSSNLGKNGWSSDSSKSSYGFPVDGEDQVMRVYEWFGACWCCRAMTRKILLRVERKGSVPGSESGARRTVMLDDPLKQLAVAHGISLKPRRSSAVNTVYPACTCINCEAVQCDLVLDHEFHRLRPSLLPRLLAREISLAPASGSTSSAATDSPGRVRSGKSSSGETTAVQTTPAAERWSRCESPSKETTAVQTTQSPVSTAATSTAAPNPTTVAASSTASSASILASIAANSSASSMLSLALVPAAPRPSTRVATGAAGDWSAYATGGCASTPIPAQCQQWYEIGCGCDCQVGGGCAEAPSASSASPTALAFASSASHSAYYGGVSSSSLSSHVPGLSADHHSHAVLSPSDWHVARQSSLAPDYTYQDDHTFAHHALDHFGAGVPAEYAPAHMHTYHHRRARPARHVPQHPPQHVDQAWAAHRAAVGAALATGSVAQHQAPVSVQARGRGTATRCTATGGWSRCTCGADDSWLVSTAPPSRSMSDTSASSALDALAAELMPSDAAWASASSAFARRSPSPPPRMPLEVALGLAAPSPPPLHSILSPTTDGACSGFSSPPSSSSVLVKPEPAGDVEDRFAFAGVAALKMWTGRTSNRVPTPDEKRFIQAWNEHRSAVKVAALLGLSGGPAASSKAQYLKKKYPGQLAPGAGAIPIVSLRPLENSAEGEQQQQQQQPQPKRRPKGTSSRKRNAAAVKPNSTGGDEDTDETAANAVAAAATGAVVKKKKKQVAPKFGDRTGSPVPVAAASAEQTVPTTPGAVGAQGVVGDVHSVSPRTQVGFGSAKSSPSCAPDAELKPVPTLNIDIDACADGMPLKLEPARALTPPQLVSM